MGSRGGWFGALTLAAVALAAIPASYAQRFPTRPIELVVPFAPGGGSGITGEMMKKIIGDEKLSPQPISITYKPGASGQVGWTYLATKKGNAHVIATSTQSFSYGFVHKQMQVAPSDFTPIALMLIDTQLMTASPASGYKTMKDVLEASRKKPGSVKVGGTGSAGSDANLALMIENAAKVKLNYIPFKSGGEVNAAILGGHVDVALGNPNELAGYVAAGKLVPLAVFSDQRVAGLKDVPTMKEVGYNVVSRSARGVVAPAGISKQEEQVLVEMMKKITQSKQWAEYADKNMMTVKFLGGADYAKYLADERETLTALLKSIGKL
ncbi:MAG TPA: tripartite tricarboxylate transporter substrate binding protein [Burkholderiales bacterium]|nr:tripartite tricarboxylate transporter substrate binding protein [Burkholderiales bacterium]